MWLGSLAGRVPLPLAVVEPKAFGRGLDGQGRRTSSRCKNQATCRSRSAHRVGWVATGRSGSPASAACRKAGFGLGVPRGSASLRSVAAQGVAVGVQRQPVQRGRAGSGGRCY
jgi:hypothetical protein